MIDMAVARELIDFNASNIGQARAEEQLRGAVAMHNILERYKVAYLADEVGMGKTYVALGAMALFRHFEPEFRVLVIAPRENIQRKWMKELGNFAKNNFRFPDLRVKSLRGGPARPIVMCDNLRDFVHEVSVDSRRDFFLRMASFSFGLGADPEGWKTQRDNLRRELPWLADEVFDLRSKEAFKDNFARAVCCALPKFDLVIVDEGHNLKHGFRTGVAARNRVMALAFGRSLDQIDSRLFPGYGKRAKRLLFLSATPIEGSYEQLWNQLDVFGLGGPFSDLKQRDVTDEAKKQTAAQFLVRRVTTVTVNRRELTKNQYRREWRQGGVFRHDQPISINDPKKRLVVALVQKKVAELLGSGKFNMSFQIGMLASFESFLQTAKLRNDDEDMIFDDAEQQRDLRDSEKDGIDVRDVNKLARDFFNTFHYHMPHPKMDAVVESLKTSWLSGRKTLVFVRRVASVTELEQKLNECYDAWLIPHMLRHLPEVVHDRFNQVVDDYRDEKQAAQNLRRSKLAAGPREAGAEDDHGGTDTFFAWFFRGDGPQGVVSGANVQQRFIRSSGAYSTFFDRNHVAEMLGAEVGGVAEALASAVGLSVREVAADVRARAAKYLSAKAKVHPSHDRFVAAQAAAIELVVERGGPLAEPAGLVFQQVYQGAEKKPHASQAPDVVEWLEERTFFTEIQRPGWSALRDVLWPASRVEKPTARFREEEVRARLLSTVARLGHGLIDMYLLTIARLGSLDLRTQESDVGGGQSRDERRITEYLAAMEKQRTTPLSERAWGAFDELRELATNFDLILDVDAPEARDLAVSDTARLFGTLLGRQQPVGGMWGKVNRTLVQQFRMPGYPFVLVTTDLLQEGEDLHTFCSCIHHYGISWTASSMEQRIGRIDRVRSQTDRRLSSLDRDPRGDDLLQVHFPHLQDTVEILQVERVLERMNVFLKLMHEGLVVASAEDKHIDVAITVARGRRPVEAILGKLHTAFPIKPAVIAGDVRAAAVTRALADEALDRLGALQQLSGEHLGIEWTPSNIEGQLFGTMHLAGSRIQPFTLLLDSLAGRLLVKCISPVGVVDLAASLEAIQDSVRTKPVRIGAVLGPEEGSYNLTVQEDVLLGERAHDEARVNALLKRVAEQADRLEQIHLPGADRTLDVFVEDLRKEGLGYRD
jgi:superfamily II DNA or RNA helicase